MRLDFRHIHLITTIGALVGIILIVSGLLLPSQVIHDLFLSLGGTLFSASIIGIIFDVTWSKERTKAEEEALQPLYEKLGKANDRLDEATIKLVKLEGRLEAFKELGFNYCHSKRSEALKSFLEYAREIIPLNANKERTTDGKRTTDGERTTEEKGNPLSAKTSINIVSSSARGLMGYLDRDPQEVQHQWRELITTYPHYFKILMTHPAFAHLRQPAEERSFGDIELEILKTAIYLHCVAGMQSDELRFYRGSPTVFSIQAGKHILLNPYPHGQMAMDTLCLEFESEEEQSYISRFMNMHFNHTWAFIWQPSKLVDEKPLVVGIQTFEDILQAFSECTFLGDSKRLRLTKAQVEELDTFTCKTLVQRHKKFAVKPPANDPFMTRVQKDGMAYSDYQDTKKHLDSVTTQSGITGE